MDSPLNQGHAHASNAEDFKSRGLFVKANEEHLLAAENFKRAMENTMAEGPRRTLKMLYTDQVNAAKDVQRKIAELEAQGKDPSVPQPAQPRRPSSGTPNSSFTHLASASSSRQNSPQSSYRNLRMTDSHLPIGESYMMLGQNAPDGADPFKDFWHNVEAMLDKFSSPVAFATAPLSPTVAPRAKREVLSFSSESETSEPEDIPSGPRIADRDVSIVQAGLADALSDRVDADLNGSLSSTIKPRKIESKRMAASMIQQEVYADDDDSSSSESFLVIPMAPTLASLQAENAKLKERLKAAEAKFANAQQHIKSRAEQEQQLRDGLLSARNQMQHRLGASTLLGNASPKVGSSMLGNNSPTFDMSFPNLKLPAVPGLATIGAPVPATSSGLSRDREGMLLRRVRELEDELRLTRDENEKQRAQILKFRERWTKLKESAKRKKSARAAAEAGRIDEDPEAEEEATETR